jgi:hypothetical protein
MSIVVCELPKAGLGNQLFPLIKAATFARLNDLPLTVIGYNQFKLGPYLRREKVKRKYAGYFTFQKSFFAEQLDRLLLLKYKGFEKVVEPVIEKVSSDKIKRKKFIFSEIPHWNDYFDGLKEHRNLAISLFWELIRDKIKQRMQNEKDPCIGIHIRMGDFRKLKAGEDFGRVGAVRTPEYYFIDSIRKLNGSSLPVSVFTDGYLEEFEKLFKLENVKIIEGNPDIIDMLLLSKSKIIVASAGSTFSYWSGFLSEAPVILHPDHIHEPIRYLKEACPLYEGSLDIFNPLLVREIKDIRSFL